MTAPQIPYGHQTVDDDDVRAVARVLRGDWLTQGPTIDAFEHALARKVGARHAVAFANGTAALHGAVVAAGVKPGDLLVTSPLTFMASANCGRYVGARIGLVDIDPLTFNVQVDRIPADAEAAVIVHYAGLPAHLHRLDRRPRVVIEDAAHALGALTPDGPVGNCAHSDMCMFSFHPVKAITTGEGGVITTNDDGLADAMRRFRSHGIRRMPECGGWYYEISELGFNYRLTDIQAALGLSQLEKLDTFVHRRNQLADQYRRLLAHLPVGLPPAAPEGYRHAYHLFPILVAERRRVFDGLRDAGIGVQVHYVPIHHHPISTDIEAKPGSFPACDKIYEQLISLPVYPGLTDDQQQRVCAKISNLLV